jgi:hypothetical protein
MLYSMKLWESGCEISRCSTPAMNSKGKQKTGKPDAHQLNISQHAVMSDHPVRLEPGFRYNLCNSPAFC